MSPDLAHDLAAIVGQRHVREARAERVTYAMDGLPTHRRVPDLVVLPGTREELIAVVRLLATLGVPFVPRGAGTRSEERRVGKSVDLGGRRIIKKKKQE